MPKLEARLMAAPIFSSYMKPTFACRIESWNPDQWEEIVLLLSKLGYIWSVEIYMAYHMPVQTDRRQIVVRYKTVYEDWDAPGIIDCGNDIRLFVLLVTLNADKEKYHFSEHNGKWFVSDTPAKQRALTTRGYK